MTAYLVRGIQAAGKSTVAQALAERLPGPSVHVHGDIFRRWIVNGRERMTPGAGPEAHRQLRLRHRLTATACDAYADAGFTPVVPDVVLGPELEFLVGAIRARPLRVVVLAPRPVAVAAREMARSKDSYGMWTVTALDRVLREETPRIGLWLDTSGLSVAATVDEILRRDADAAVR
ncbi:phosphotransferase-like protein [Pseudonocardia nigra]|uniref:phosphotransferase-like protein n=1 Tax=Pseudonocardia nigra TaxID=1921578 RepID=UPI001C60450C|nr:phosphotransferase [Pseudonocardia nigra]